jgi:prenyltransferase beta subunit
MIYRLLFITLLLGSFAGARAQGILDRRDDRIPPQVDIIYERGLSYLAKSQNADGSWNGSSGDEPGVVGLCVAAFLAHGTDPNHGEYAQVIKRGIDYILSKQNKVKDNGYIGTSMYNHAFSTLALAEAYGVVDNPEIGEALKKAVDLILSAQKRNPSGAWRYKPDARDADTTVAGSQIVALFAARNAGFPVPDEAIRKGLAYLTSCRGSNGSYGYTSSAGGKPTLTAIGVLCLSLGKDTDSKGYKTSLDYLTKNLDFRDRSYPYYFEYYMSQALFHADETVWKEWNNRNIRYIGTIQSADGSFPGNHGQAFSTAGALLSLALNYRYLPIYEK